MARFSYTAHTDTTGAYFKYSISELSYPWGSGAFVSNFNGNGYFIAGITEYPFISGRTAWLGYGDPVIDSISDGYEKKYPSTIDTSFTGYTYMSSWFRLSSARYVYPFAATSNANGSPAYPLTMWGITETGSVLDGYTHPGVYIQMPSVVIRPESFYWSDYGSSPPDSTSVLWLPKATAWNGLRNNIIQLLVYKGLLINASDFYDSALPTVSSGTPITAAMYNQAVYYINYMHGGTYLSSVTAGAAPIYAHYWYQLQYYINGIG